MAESLPTLSLDGMVHDPLQKADRLLAYFFSSDAHQSNAFYGSIYSLPYILQQNANNPTDVASAASSALNALFDKYYDTVDCNVETQAASNVMSGNRASMNLNVRLNFTQGGKSYNLARIAEIVDSKLSKVAEVI